MSGAKLRAACDRSSSKACCKTLISASSWGVPDQKAYDHQALSGSRCRVHILDAGDLMHQVLDGQRHALFHLAGDAPGIAVAMSSIGTESAAPLRGE